MKIKTIIFTLLLAGALPAYSQDEPTAGDYALDISFYRPFGLISTLVGTVGFVATLPTSVVASVFALDDSVLEAGKEFVYEPASFTFSRPLGESPSKWHGKYWADKRAAAGRI